MAKSKIQWSNYAGKITDSAGGKRDVLLIVSEEPLEHDDVVQRRPALPLTETVIQKLEIQGVAKAAQGNDRTILETRYSLDNECQVRGVVVSEAGNPLKKEKVENEIKNIMKNYKGNGGVILHYVGHGRRITGDWCFQDGYITFRELAMVYLEVFRGRVLTIVSDCSHAGSWVKNCIEFLDEQEVKPCGHSAKDKGILIKVIGSCLSSQIPQQLSYSTIGCKNDKLTGNLIFTRGYDTIRLFDSKIAEGQHVIAQDCTRVKCGQDSITDRCLCLPQASWNIWTARNRIFIVKGKDRNKHAWHILAVDDDDEKILEFYYKTQVEHGEIDCRDYGDVLKSGWGKLPTEKEERSVTHIYDVFKKKKQKK